MALSLYLHFLPWLDSISVWKLVVVPVFANVVVVLPHFPYHLISVIMQYLTGKQYPRRQQHSSKNESEESHIPSNMFLKMQD